MIRRSVGRHRADEVVVTDDALARHPCGIERIENREPRWPDDVGGVHDSITQHVVRVQAVAGRVDARDEGGVVRVGGTHHHGLSPGVRLTPHARQFSERRRDLGRHVAVGVPVEYEEHNPREHGTIMPAGLAAGRRAVRDPTTATRAAPRTRQSDSPHLVEPGTLEPMSVAQSSLTTTETSQTPGRRPH
jgi:hypothetical protein